MARTWVYDNPPRSAPAPPATRSTPWPPADNSRAPKKVANGHKSVTVIPLADIQKVEEARSKRGKAIGVLVTTTAGVDYKFTRSALARIAAAVPELNGQHGHCRPPSA